MATHGLFEMGIFLCMIVSTLCAFELINPAKNRAPRWVFYLNLAFGPALFSLAAVNLLIGLFH